MTLRDEFLKHYPVDENGYSAIALMEDLENINPAFRTNNGVQWARKGSKWNGVEYKTDIQKQKGRAYSVQLVGFVDEAYNSSIPLTVRAKLKNKPCVVTGSKTGTEIDHKYGRGKISTSNVEDYQILHKTVNDVKRQRCKECNTTGLRFDAEPLTGVSFIKGDIHSPFCEGCYWYDCHLFMTTISANYRSKNEI